jgi:hypothetical protein
VPALIEYELGEASGRAELMRRLRLTDLTLRIQQTLEALDIFRAVAGLSIIPVTEMLHQTTFQKLAAPCSTIVLIFLHKQRGIGRWQT